MCFTVTYRHIFFIKKKIQHKVFYVCGKKNISAIYKLNFYENFLQTSSSLYSVNDINEIYHSLAFNFFIKIWISILYKYSIYKYLIHC